MGGFPQECVAIVADMARIDWEHGDYRARIRALMKEVSTWLPISELGPDLRGALNKVCRLNETSSFHAHSRLKVAIEALREACGPRMMPWLLTG